METAAYHSAFKANRVKLSERLRVFNNVSSLRVGYGSAGAHKRCA
jgi:hypothetical protein